jgi:hypothetical protein
MLACNRLTGGGGWSSAKGGVSPTHHVHYMGGNPGTVIVRYQNYVKADDIEIFYRGHPIAGTGGPRSWSGEIRFDWKPIPGDHSVDVVVTGSMWGTRWTYYITCPLPAAN